MMISFFIKLKNIFTKICENFMYSYIATHKRSYFALINAELKSKNFAYKNINHCCTRCGSAMIVLADIPTFGFCESYLQTRSCPVLAIGKTSKDGIIRYKLL